MLERPKIFPSQQPKSLGISPSDLASKSHGVKVENGQVTWMNNTSPIQFQVTTPLLPMLLKIIPNHDDVIKGKHFPRYWPFVRGIDRSPVNSPHKASDAEVWCFPSSVPEETVE